MSGARLPHQKNPEEITALAPHTEQTHCQTDINILSMPPQDRTDMAHSCAMSQTFLYKFLLSPAWLTQVSQPYFFCKIPDADRAIPNRDKISGCGSHFLIEGQIFLLDIIQVAGISGMPESYEVRLISMPGIKSKQKLD